MIKPLFSIEELIQFSTEEDFYKQIEHISNILLFNQKKKDIREDRKSYEDFLKNHSPPKITFQNNIYKRKLEDLIREGKREEIIQFLQEYSLLELQELN